jgi:hypothetical protein
MSSQEQIDFSPERGYMHFIGSVDKSEPLLVIANAGAQLMNSKHYFNQHISSSSAEIISNNEAHMRTWMFGFTNPKDVFLHRFADERHLDVIRRSFANINIPLTNEYFKIEQEFPITGSIMPQVLDPDILGKKNLQQTSEANLAAYRKNIAQQIWEKAGVPTPKTVVISRDISSSKDISGYLEQFKEYDELVINIIGGSGGFGLKFVPREKAVNEVQTMMKQFPEEEVIMIQGKLPLAASPAVIFAISNKSVEMLQVSEQRFTSPGVYGGNSWYKGIISLYEYQYPGFVETCFDAAEALRTTGVRGQVNIDVLLLSKENANKYKSSQILMREANVRSSGSSPIIRFTTNGNIKGKDITSVITNTHYKVDEDSFCNFKAPFDHNITTVLYNYAQDGTLFFATLGTNDVSLKELQAYEKNTLYCLHPRE